MPVYGDPKRLFVDSLCGLLLHECRRGTNVQRFIGSRSDLPLLRFELAELAIKKGAEWILWLDSDQIVTDDTAERLLAHNAPIVGCNYARRGDPLANGVPPLSTARDFNDAPVAPAAGVEKVERLGLGCCLTSVEVFSKIGEPWFANGFDHRGNYVSEDYWFFDQARKAGYDVLLDHSLSIGHVGDYNYKLAV